MADLKEKTYVEDVDRSVYDIRDAENDAYRMESGLTPEIVEKLSTEKDDPVWMQQFRLESLQIYNEMKIPNWGPSIEGLDMDHIATYVRPNTKMRNDWKDVPEDIKETFERLGIPQAERKSLAGVGAQYDSLRVNIFFFHIFNSHHGQSVRRCGRSRSLPVARREDLLYLLRLDLTSADLYQRPGNNADHIVQKPVAGHPDCDDVVRFCDAARIDCPDRGLHLRVDRTEALEVVLSFQVHRRPAHLLHIQAVVVKVSIQPSRRHAECPVQNAVLICLAAVLIARMPVRRNLAGTLHDNILGQTLIQRKRNLIRRHARRRIENCHVSQRMYAGIRAARAGHCDLLPQKRGKMAVQHLLDRDSVGLHLPSFIIRAVVRHDHFYTFYLFLQTISPCSFIVATAQRFCTE